MVRRWRSRRQGGNNIGGDGSRSTAEGSRQESRVAVSHRDALDALMGACKEAGMPLGAVGLFLTPVGDGEAAAVLDYRRQDRSAPEYPPSIRVDVSGHAREVVRESIIDAIIEAADGEQPEKFGGGFVDPEREARWPELRERGPRREGLREKLEAVEVDAGGHVAVWFNRLARQLGLVAYDSGVAVRISGQAAAESGVAGRLASIESRPRQASDSQPQHLPGVLWA